MKCSRWSEMDALLSSTHPNKDTSLQCTPCRRHCLVHSWTSYLHFETLLNARTPTGISRFSSFPATRAANCSDLSLVLLFIILHEMGKHSRNSVSHNFSDSAKLEATVSDTCTLHVRHPCRTRCTVARNPDGIKDFDQHLMCLPCVNGEKSF